MIRSSSASIPDSSSSLRGSSVPFKESTASTSAWSSPERTRVERPRSPRSNMIASMRIDFPAPVSPVKMENPEPKSTSNSLMVAKFLIFRWSSMNRYIRDIREFPGFLPGFEMGSSQIIHNPGSSSFHDLRIDLAYARGCFFNCLEEVLGFISMSLEQHQDQWLIDPVKIQHVCGIIIKQPQSVFN